jgi:serine/threonine protein kinase
MMPMDLLSDDRHLYSVMPFCDGGELFERLDMEEKFPEPEARYWMVQVLNVSTYLLFTRGCLCTWMNVSLLILTRPSPLELTKKSGSGKSSKCWHLSS